MNQSREQLTAERLREILEYRAGTGVFRWRQSRSNRVKVGGIAGCDAGPVVGRIIRIDGKMYRASRVAWAYVTGQWPTHPIGTKNGNPRDVSWDNLVESPLGTTFPPNPKSSGTVLTAERLREFVEYDPGTGLFSRRVTLSNRTEVGKVAGRITDRGYVKFMVDGRSYLAHNLAWLYVHGDWPRGTIDHIDRDRSNNRISNLRLATASQNQANRGKQRNNTSGYKGVYWVESSGKWLAKVVFRGRQYSFGLHDSAEAAHDAYCVGAKKIHGEFAAT